MADFRKLLCLDPPPARRAVPAELLSPHSIVCLFSRAAEAEIRNKATVIYAGGAGLGCS